MTDFHLDFADERRVALVVLGKLYADKDATTHHETLLEEVRIFDHGGDRSTPGLYLQVGNDGTASFHLRIPLSSLGIPAGRQESVGGPIGRYPDMSPLEARLEAKAAWEDSRRRRGMWGERLEAAENASKGLADRRLGKESDSLGRVRERLEEDPVTGGKPPILH